MLLVAYKNLNELMDRTGTGDAISPDWDYNGPQTVEFAKFYQQWSVYLTSMSQVFTYMLAIPGWLTKSLYSLTFAVENVYNNLFKLFGLFDYLSDDTSFLGKIYNGLQIVGAAIFVLLLMMKVTMSFLSSPVRYKDTLNHLILVTAVTAFLPQTIKWFTGLIGSDIQNVAKMGDEAGANGASSLSIKPIQNNVVDLYIVMSNNFDTQKLGYGDDGYLNPNKADPALNNINDSNITSLDFTSWYGATDKDTLKKLKEKGGNFKGAARLLSSKLSSADEGNVRIEKVKESWWNEFSNVFSPVYLRYKVNWLGLFAQQIILLILLVSMAVRFVKSAYSILITALIAPIVGYTSVESSEKFKELLNTIVGGIAGLMFEVIMLRVALIVLQNYSYTVFQVGKTTSTDFSTGLTYWEGVIAAFIVYAGVYFALVGGNNSIERWLGISTAQDGGSQLVGAGRSIYNTGSAAANAGTTAVLGKKNMDGSRQGGLVGAAKTGARAAKGIGKGVGQGVKKGTKGAISVAGGARGLADAMSKKSGGVGAKQTAANLGARGVASAKSSLKTGASNAAQPFKAAKANFDSSRDNMRNMASTRPSSGDSGSRPENPGGIGGNTSSSGGSAANHNSSAGIGKTNNSSQGVSKKDSPKKSSDGIGDQKKS